MIHRHSEFLENINPGSDVHVKIATGAQCHDRSYGTKGGGILKWFNTNYENIITVTSLAKAFGVPIAAISGNTTFIEAFINSSETRMYSSPVSMANINAAFNALSINETSGDQIRKKLWSNVSFIRDEFKALGINLTGSIFPVQSINHWPPDKVTNLSGKLNNCGIKTALVLSHMNYALSLTIVIRANNTIQEIQTLIHAIQDLTR